MAPCVRTGYRDTTNVPVASIGRSHRLHPTLHAFTHHSLRAFSFSFIFTYHIPTVPLLVSLFNTLYSVTILSYFHTHY